MYEIHDLAAAVAEDVLYAEYEQVQPDSRLFRDLQALASMALSRDELQIEPIRPH